MLIGIDNFEIEKSLAMKTTVLFLSFFISISVFGQNSSIEGSLKDESAVPVTFANVVLYSSEDSTIVKVETSNDKGEFLFQNIAVGSYYVVASFIGYNEFNTDAIKLNSDETISLDPITMLNSSVELETAIVTAKRAMVEVKPDRTVFNVQGTINSVGDNGLDLLRKAPGVLLDNNNSVTVLGRAGVIFYIDGKRLPISGDDLTNYLRNLTADQIDRIDIISNPGAKYEAEGNAGIIDIRLKKDKSHGSNGSLNYSYSKGKRDRWNINSTGNYRNSKLNTFGMLGYNDSDNLNLLEFIDFQNGLKLIKNTDIVNSNKGVSYRWGTDFFISKNATIGFLLNGSRQDVRGDSNSFAELGTDSANFIVDSVLVAANLWDQENVNNTYNLNYVFSKEDVSLNIDADFGRYTKTADFRQPNIYYNNVSLDSILTQNTLFSSQPVNIDIYTFKVDYERNALGGRLGIGTKYSQVDTDNFFELENFKDNASFPVFSVSNDFFYSEKVYAGYLSYSRKVNDKINFTGGLRVENTDAVGDLIVNDTETQIPNPSQDPPVVQNYVSFFPSLGLTYSPSMGNTWAINYGRRINRPDYNVLNPFEIQLSELSFSKGNAFLQPEIVNNIEVGYTLKWKYNFKIAYSKTTNQITRLIAPDDRDPRAGFINWDNLTDQTTISFNASLPFEVTSYWNAYFNLSMSKLDNQADYGNGVVVDLQVLTYNVFQQHTFNLPKGFTGELSGWYSGPGVWGGVFEYNSSWSLNLGLSKSFFENKLTVKLSASDIFLQAFWDGTSEFSGLLSEGRGEWDSRRGAINLSYNFGNQNVKSRNRNTGLEDEMNRVGEN